MKKIDCIIVDDEPMAISLLEDYMNKVEYINLIGKFNNPIEAITFINKNSVDLIFLDIEMPDINGFKLAEMISQNSAIIFTTAYSNYGAGSYDYNALDYLLKPISFERFLISVNKFDSSSNNQIKLEDDTIFIKSNKAYIRLKYEDIGHIESLKDYVIFHTENERFIVYHSLKKLENILPTNFKRVHYSYMVNLENVHKLKDNHLYIFDKKVSISKKHRHSVYELIEKKKI
ncbi:response regulator [Flavobacteriaceae bacterium AU392]|nr:DNA-binding response regulator [Flavobacteriaceae bacterium]RKM86055.1 response regulator [Flavobacteriaceae bacterium AU392]